MFTRGRCASLLPNKVDEVKVKGVLLSMGLLFRVYSVVIWWIGARFFTRCGVCYVKQIELGLVFLVHTIHGMNLKMVEPFSLWLFQLEDLYWSGIPIVFTWKFNMEPIPISTESTNYSFPLRHLLFEFHWMTFPYNSLTAEVSSSKSNFRVSCLILCASICSLWSKNG